MKVKGRLVNGSDYKLRMDVAQAMLVNTNAKLISAHCHDWR
jgi:hypothetical protein